MTFQRVMTGCVLLAAVAAADPALAGAKPEAEQIAREVVRTEINPAMMDELYLQAAEAASTNFQLAIQPGIKRALTDDEKQRLFVFWHEEMKVLLPYSAIEDMMVPIVSKNLSEEDLREVQRFFDTPAGRHLIEVKAVLMREGRAAGEQLGKRLADKDWQARVTAKMAEQFPQWFPEAPLEE